VVNYKKPLNRRELKFIEQQPRLERRLNIFPDQVPVVRALALVEIVVSGLVLILLWSSYKEIRGLYY